MGKLIMFGISLNNNEGVYYAGQLVEGQVVIELRDTMKMRGVRLRFQGSGSVSWSETQSTGTGKDSTTETVSYTADENYFDDEILLAGRWKSQSGEDIQLHAGRHVFPFAFQLPPQLPSSFEGEHGNVRFTMKGTIDKPWKFDHTTKRPFTVICLLDLNREPTATHAVEESKSKQFCCLCCASGPVRATLVMDRRGYVPGEAILINAEIDNQSTREIKKSSAVLTMITEFHATTSTNTTRKPIAHLTHGRILPGETDYWNMDQLVIPPTPPSYLRGCSIIDITYILELRVVPSGPGRDLVLPVEVIIGTIPLPNGGKHTLMGASQTKSNPGVGYSYPLSKQGCPPGKS